jgi:hypothetical protein
MRSLLGVAAFAGPTAQGKREGWRRRPPAWQGARMAEPRILVDADACPVKEEIFRVAFRLKVPVTVVSNSPFRVPAHPLVSRMVVNDGFDAADDWIAERADGAAVVVTADILLADRCLKAGAQVISPTGRPFTPSSIGNAVAVRAIMSDLRAGGDRVGGPAPFAKADRSRFLSALDAALVAVRRRG